LSEQDHKISRKLVNPLIEPLRIPSPKHRHRGKPTIVATDHNLVTVEFFSSLILFATGVHFLPVILYDQGYPKVCPNSLNLPNTGDPFCRNIVVIFLFSVFPRPGT
jgi:hypothetical protein